MSEVIEQIKQQIESNTVLLYMKGNPNQPQCGFSARTVQALMEVGKRFAYVDILSNPEIRANLPAYANWPTFPQLWVNGELVGGCDIITEMGENGELKELIDAEEPKKILSDDKIVTLMKAEGIDIARRTVAKYRESLRIPSSVQRRREKKSALQLT